MICIVLFIYYLIIVCPLQNIHFVGGSEDIVLFNAEFLVPHKAGVQKSISGLAGWLGENE